MTDAFLTITEAVQYTGKSRRTLHRLAQQLAKTAPDHVLRERTNKGMIWRIHHLRYRLMVACISAIARSISSSVRSR